MMAVVAEMMILANSAVAERLMAAFPGHAFLRRHQSPRLDAFTEVSLSKMLRQLQNPSSLPQLVRQILACIGERNNELQERMCYKTVVRFLSTYRQQEDSPQKWLVQRLARHLRHSFPMYMQPAEGRPL